MRGRQLSLGLTNPAEPETKWRLPSELPDLSGAKAIGLDIETHDPHLNAKGPGVRRDGKMVGIAVGVGSDGPRWYLPFGHEEGPQFDRAAVLRWAKAELTRPNQPKIGAGLLYDLDYLAEAGVDVKGPFWDVQVAEPLLDENRQHYSLDSVAKDRLGAGAGKFEATLEAACRARGLKGAPQKHIWELPARFVGEYAEGDVDQAIKVFERQLPELERQGLRGLFDLETRLVPVLLGMRRRGVPVDTAQAKKVQDNLLDRLKRAKAALRRQAGFEVDYWAAASIAKAFDARGIPYPRTPKSNQASFTKEWLAAEGTPLARLVGLCRRLDKFESTFIRGTILGTAVRGRIHCEFNQLRGDDSGTVTGRFSSSHPNLQFIPARDPVFGPMIRSIFVPEDGCDWDKYDYSQIELRILAHYAMGDGAAALRAAFNANPRLDLHQWCGDEAGVSRRAAKTVNFGIVYGMGVDKLAATLGLTRAAAAEFLEVYFGKLPFIKETIKAATDTAARRGYVKTVLGRRRRFEFWEANDWELSKALAPLPDRAAMERRVAEAVAAGMGKAKGVRRAWTYRALNSIVQGSAADLLKKAMVDAAEDGVLDALPLHLTVHDELGVSRPRTGEGEEAARHLKHLMEQAIKFKVPVLADRKSGPSWGACG